MGHWRVTGGGIRLPGASHLSGMVGWLSVARWLLGYLQRLGDFAKGAGDSVFPALSDGAGQCGSPDSPRIPHRGGLLSAGATSKIWMIREALLNALYLSNEANWVKDRCFVTSGVTR